jgi:hypothetical protein
VEARAGDAGVDAEEEWEERDGEEERFHQRIGTGGAYGERGETLVIMEWRKWRRWGRGDRWEGSRRPPPRHSGFFSFSGVGVGWLFFWESSSALWLSGATRLWGKEKKSSESMRL